MSSNEEEKTGFAGIGKRIDDLKAGGSTEDAKAWQQVAAEPQQEKPESVKEETAQKVYPPKVERKTGPSFRLSFAKVFWVIVGLLILISLFSKGSNNTRFNEEMPPVGRGHKLYTSQIRYCVYQKQRIEVIRNLLDSTNSYHLGKFNDLVDDYNSRCSGFLYRGGSLQSVQQELGNANSQLQEEARQIVSSWGYSSSSQNTGTAATSPRISDGEGKDIIYPFRPPAAAPSPTVPTKDAQAGIQRSIVDPTRNKPHQQNFRSVTPPKWFLHKLTRLVPDWQAINNDPNFLDWLRQTDPSSQITRHDQLSEAYAKKNVESVAYFFIRYKNESKATR